MRPFRPHITAAAVALSLVTASAPALADAAEAHVPPPTTTDAPGPTEAEALSDQAVEAFGDERYDESIALFEQAYALNANPNYLFNIGRVYEEKGDLAEAVSHYQRFVSQPGVDIDAREAATARLKVLRDALDQLEEDEPAPVEEPSTEPAPAEEELETPTLDGEPRDRKRGQQIAGYTLLGMGGVGLIVGGVLGGMASSKARDADDAEFVDDRLRMRDDARRQARSADAMFITGGILAAGGLVLVLTTLGKKKRRSQASRGSSRAWALTPAASPTGAGAAFHGRF